MSQDLVINVTPSAVQYSTSLPEMFTKKHGSDCELVGLVCCEVGQLFSSIAVR